MTPTSETAHDHAIRGMHSNVESLPIQIIESEGRERRIGVPFPNDPYKFIPQAEKDLLESYSRKNHQVRFLISLDFPKMVLWRESKTKDYLWTVGQDWRSGILSARSYLVR